MTAKVSLYRDVLYSRDYANDQPAYISDGLAKRVALAAVPFLSLHPSLRLPISLGMGSLRVWNSGSDDLQLAFAIAALVAAIFNQRIGMAITTVDDILSEIGRLEYAGNKQEALKGLIKIANSLVYLALITVGGLELSVVAFALQTVVQLIQSNDEFNKDRWIEGVSNLLMAAVRLRQTHSQYQLLKRNWQIEAAIKKFNVGQLHEKWQFPSDHLPVGVEVDGVKIVSWNVLNKAYMDWVTEKDSQGLNHSMISDLNVVVNDSGLTLREIVVAGMVSNMMAQNQVVALQECSEQFLDYLHTQLPSNWSMVKSFDTPRIDQDVILYNTEQLAYQAARSETTQSAYPSVPGRLLQNGYFSNKAGKDLRIINSHIPGDPTKPGPEEFARYVHQQQSNSSTTVAVGDNNFERHEMIDAYRKAGFTDFNLHSPWQTNIDPVTKESKGIDHIFVVGNESRELRASEVLPGGNLRETIALLNPANMAS